MKVLFYLWRIVNFLDRGELGLSATEFGVFFCIFWTYFARPFGHFCVLILWDIKEFLREAAQQGYANATELADYLVAKGVPFREAHHIVGEAVVEAIRQGKPLEDLPLSELQKFSQVIDEDVYPILSLQSCLDKRAAKAASHRSRWRRRLLLRRLGLGVRTFICINLSRLIAGRQFFYGKKRIPEIRKSSRWL